MGTVNNDTQQAMRSTGESDRSAEFKTARSKLLAAVDSTFEEVWAAKDASRSFKFGSAVFGILGIKRDVVADPFGGHALMSESTMSYPGLRVATDPDNGQEVIFIRRPDKSTIEIRRDTQLEMATLPSDPDGDWRAVQGSGHDPLASFTETSPDGSSQGYSIMASGSVIQRSRETGQNGMSRSMPIAPTDVPAIEEATVLLETLRGDIFLD